MYNPKSHNAEEFISHQEILDSIKYADVNKNNIELIDKILEKAKLGKGLTHKEASVLLACDIEDKNNEIFVAFFCSIWYIKKEVSKQWHITLTKG